MQSRWHIPNRRNVDVWSVRGTGRLRIGSSWNLTFMQNQIEKGKVTMTKSRDVRTRSHSQAPKPEDLVPKKKLGNNYIRTLPYSLTSTCWSVLGIRGRGDFSGNLE